MSRFKDAKRLAVPREGVKIAEKKLKEQERIVHFGDDYFHFSVEDYNTKTPVEEERYVRNVSFTCVNGMYNEIVELFGLDGMYIPEDEDHFRFTAKVLIGNKFTEWIWHNSGAIKINRPEDVIKHINTDMYARQDMFNTLTW